MLATITTPGLNTMTIIRFAIRCEYYACKHFWTQDVPEDQTFKLGRETRIRGLQVCPNCGLNTLMYKRIKAKKTETECRGDCWSAKGVDCHCSCGGDNHGRSYLLVSIGAPLEAPRPA